ncbi:TVP38/TMEM64 family protein [Bacillus benzoevorans]|uniref:TVP38/TMEM64 family membrane protein n=1 Tax=Bacillus benzoevorans TaxID=1456 RepID=A0A7X0HTL1_9BACI|nr:VTT domain-containing protein [Bacillus benzoevorans]MBB6445667.1 putative membrane protein YdjX (TVP38/TMEM64 family) [Bacillus benzoevorans]
MDESMSILLVVLGAGGVLAPVAFILFHLIRQFLFIPVTIVCLAGGILFGALFGTLLSLIGLLLNSVCFYFLIGKMPKTYEKLAKLKRKWFGEYRNLTVAQTAVLRLIPLIHFHLLNFCLMEKDRRFSPYMKNNLLSNLPLAFFYSAFGSIISLFTPLVMAVIFLSLMVLVYLLREKVTVIKWQKFFSLKEG